MSVTTYIFKRKIFKHVLALLFFIVFQICIFLVIFLLIDKFFLDHMFFTSIMVLQIFIISTPGFIIIAMILFRIFGEDRVWITIDETGIKFSDLNYRVLWGDITEIRLNKKALFIKYKVRDGVRIYEQYSNSKKLLNIITIFSILKSLNFKSRVDFLVNSNKKEIDSQVKKWLNKNINNIQIKNNFLEFYEGKIVTSSYTNVGRIKKLRVDQRRLIHSQHYPIISLNEMHQKLRRRDRFDLNQSVANEVFYGFKVIKMNSQYIEVVDSSFDGYGKDITILMIFFSAFCGLLTWGNIGLIKLMITDFNMSDLVFMPFIWLMSIGFYTIFFMFLRVYYLRELRSYTYRPIRFNRANGKVYAFDEFGQVHVGDWQRMMFVPTKVATQFTPQKHETQGFMYSSEGQGYSHVIRFGIGFHKEYCLSQWEFIRRYMQDGAAQFMPNLAGFQAGKLSEEEAYKLWYCLDIDGKRETPKVSWEVVQLHNMEKIQGPTAKYVIFGLLYLFRRLMMRVAKVPHWPQWVEDECKVAADDPYVVSAVHGLDADKAFDIIIATRDQKHYNSPHHK